MLWAVLIELWQQWIKDDDVMTSSCHFSVYTVLQSSENKRIRLKVGRKKWNFFLKNTGFANICSYKSVWIFLSWDGRFLGSTSFLVSPLCGFVSAWVFEIQMAYIDSANHWCKVINVLTGSCKEITYIQEYLFILWRKKKT